MRTAVLLAVLAAVVSANFSQNYNPNYVAPPSDTAPYTGDNSPYTPTDTAPYTGDSPAGGYGSAPYTPSDNAPYTGDSPAGGYGSAPYTGDSPAGYHGNAPYTGDSPAGGYGDSPAGDYTPSNVEDYHGAKPTPCPEELAAQKDKYPADEAPASYPAGNYPDVESDIQTYPDTPAGSYPDTTGYPTEEAPAGYPGDVEADTETYGGEQPEEELEYCEEDTDANVEDYNASAPAPSAYGQSSGGSCSTEGDMRCNGTGFDTCDHGAWVYRACGAGTACNTNFGPVICDWPVGSPEYNDPHSHDWLKKN